MRDAILAVVTAVVTVGVIVFLASMALSMMRDSTNAPCDPATQARCEGEGTI